MDELNIDQALTELDTRAAALTQALDPERRKAVTCPQNPLHG
jgi:hypothetical protein